MSEKQVTENPKERTPPHRRRSSSVRKKVVREFGSSDDEFVIEIFHPERRKVISPIKMEDTIVQPKKIHVNDEEFLSRNHITKNKSNGNNLQKESDNSDEKTGYETNISSETKKLALSRNERIIQGIIGPRKILSELEFNLILKRVGIVDKEIQNYFKTPTNIGESVYDARLLEKHLVEIVNSSNNNNEIAKLMKSDNNNCNISTIVKSSISNMKNVVLSPKKK